jgi:hypothetical protein
MEQHYIIVFSISGEQTNIAYTTAVIILKYPGHPYLLLQALYQDIQDSSMKGFGKFIHKDSICIKSLTRVK